MNSPHQSKPGIDPRSQGDATLATGSRLTPRIARWLLPLLVVLVTVLVFLPTLENRFVNWDDEKNFIENPHYRGLGWTQLRWMFTTLHLGPYQPLSWMTLGLDYLLWGLNPVGYHLTNLLLHAANAVVFYFLTLRLLPLALSPPPGPGDLPLRVVAGFAALIFAIHPLRVESVAWATERRDVLSGLFFLLTLLCYLRAATTSTEDGTSRRWLVGAVSCYALSLLSKAIGMTLPVILVVLDIYPLRRLGGAPGQWFKPAARRIWWEKVPFPLLALVAGVLALIGQYEAGAMEPLERSGVAARIAQTLYGLAFYLWKTLVPLRLSPLYLLPAQLDPFAGPFLLSGAVVLAISVGLLVACRRWPAGLAVWASYVVILMPVSGIVQIGMQIAADRYTYLACLGWAVLAGGGSLVGWRAYINGRISRQLFALMAGLATLAVAGLGVLTWKQVQVWHDSERLWRHVLAVDPKSDVAHNNLGFILVEQGQLDEAIYHYRQALRIEPRDANFHLNLGIALARQGQLDEAIYHYRQALQLQPTHAEVHDSLADALANLGKVEEAIHHYLKAVKIRPGFVQAHNNLGNILSRQGKLDEAIQHYQQALQIQPNFAQAYNNLGAALVRQGKLDEAISQYRQAVQIQPTYAEAHSNLGWALGQAGRLEEAIVSYQTALQVAPKDWPHRQFVQNKLNETRARLQMDKSR
jgi:tetratricopeptide (TPR) repeat protein